MSESGFYLDSPIDYSYILALVISGDRVEKNGRPRPRDSHYVMKEVFVFYEARNRALHRAMVRWNTRRDLGVAIQVSYNCSW
jgi:hypothetical protein